MGPAPGSWPLDGVGDRDRSPGLAAMAWRPALTHRHHVAANTSGGSCRRYWYLHQPDDLGFLGLVVPDEQIAPFSKLGVDEVVQGYGAVHYVGLGQAGPVL